MIISFKITILLNITIYIIILKSNIFLIYLLFSLIFPAIHVIEKSHYWCFTEETLGITVSVTKISRNKFGGAAIITGRRQVRGGGREKEREVRMTGKREPASERKKETSVHSHVARTSGSSSRDSVYFTSGNTCALLHRTFAKKLFIGSVS